MRLFIAVLLVVGGGALQVHAQEAAPKSPERKLCERLTSAVRSVIGYPYVSNMTLVDQIECFKQPSGVDAGKYCMFRHEYKRRYLLRDAAGVEFYDALVDYFGDAVSQDQPIKPEGEVVLGKQACEAVR